MLLNTYLHGIYRGIMKILLIRKAFKLRLSLMMTLNNENPFRTTAKTFSSSPYLDSLYFYISMDFPIYLPTKKNFAQTFFLKKYCWRIPYLPTVWTHVRTFIVYFFGPSPKPFCVYQPWLCLAAGLVVIQIT